MDTTILYFGCWQREGHYYFAPGMRECPRGPFPPWLYQIDNRATCPADPRGLPYEEQEREGRALVHHRDGWTALAFWDRSVDSRHNSKSVFAIEKVYDFEEALALAREAFPEVFARYTFQVVPA